LQKQAGNPGTKTTRRSLSGYAPPNQIWNTKVPTAPLRPLLVQAARRVDDGANTDFKQSIRAGTRVLNRSSPNWRALSRNLAFRMGKKPESVERLMFRVMQVDRMGFAVADELAIALGYHPAEIWREWCQPRRIARWS
jgi:hypothetical protein